MTMSKAPPQAVVVVAVLTFLHVLVSYNKDELFAVSIDHIKFIRANYYSSSAEYLFLKVAELGDKYCVPFFIFVSFHMMSMPRSQVLSMAVGIQLALSCVLKSFYHDPRPFFVADIQPMQCRFEHGNPSGHSMVAFAFYWTFIDMMLQEYEVKDSVVRGLCWVLKVMIVLVLGASRIYTGVHTYNQVLVGWLYGFLLYYLFTKVFFNYLIHFYSNMKERSLKSLVFSPAILTWVPFYLCSIYLFVTHEAEDPLAQEWIANIKKNCTKIKGLDVNPELGNFLGFHHSLTYVSGVIGTIVEQKYMATAAYPYWHRTSLKVSLLRIFFGTLFTVPNLLVILAVKSSNSFWMVLGLKYLFPALFGGFQIYGLNKWLAVKLGVANLSPDKLKAQ